MKTPAIALAILLGASVGTAQGETKTPDPKTLIEQLGHADYDTRTKAEEALRKIGKPAIEDLKAAAKSADDPEVQWRAGRLIREIEEGTAPRSSGLSKRKRKGLSSREGSKSGSADPFEALEKSLEVDGLDDDARTAIRNAMKQLRESMERARVGFPRLDIDIPDFPVIKMPGASGGVSQGRSMKMQSGPDGVRVEIEETDADGKKSKKVYEGESLEEIKKAHPEVFEKSGIDFGFPRIGGGGFGVEPFKLRPGRKSLRRRAPTPAPVPAPTSGKKLGFYPKDVPPAVRDYLGLGATEGLMVESVVEGTLAETLGVRNGDVVVRVGGQRIGSSADVSNALEGIANDADVTVEVLRRGRKLTLRHPGRKAGEAKTDAKVGSGKLRRR